MRLLLTAQQTHYTLHCLLSLEHLAYKNDFTGLFFGHGYGILVFIAGTFWLLCAILIVLAPLFPHMKTKKVKLKTVSKKELNFFFFKKKAHSHIYFSALSHQRCLIHFKQTRVRFFMLFILFVQVWKLIKTLVLTKQLTLLKNMDLCCKWTPGLFAYSVNVKKFSQRKSEPKRLNEPKSGSDIVQQHFKSK